MLNSPFNLCFIRVHLWLKYLLPFVPDSQRLLYNRKLTSICKPFTVFAMWARGFKVIRRWVWALLYAGILLAVLPYTPMLLRWLERFALPLFSGLAPKILGLCAWALLVLYASFARPKRRALRGVGLTLIGAVYAVLLLFVIHFPAERLHLLEYGLLGVLVWRASPCSERTLLRVWRTAAFLAVVSLLDEGIQGLIPGRYYDIRDLYINLAAGGLGAAVLSLAGRGRPVEAIATRPPYHPAADIMAAIVIAAVVTCAATVGRPPFDEQAIAGAWGRPGECGTFEEIAFDGADAFTWSDRAGNRARGRYALGGNRLDGPLLQIDCNWAENRSQCGFHPGFAANMYITIETDRFFLNVAPEVPLIRIVQ